MLIFAILLVSPALAHRKYKPHHKSLTRWVLMRHSHEQAESVKSTTPKQSEAKKFDLLGGAFDVVAGAWKAIGNMVETILSGEERTAREAEKQSLQKVLPYVESISLSHAMVAVYPGGFVSVYVKSNLN